VLFVSAAASLANAINIQALPRPREFCFGRHSFNHFSGSTVIEILNVATLHADQVDVRLHIRIESCLTLWQIQFLDQAVFRQNLKCLVDCCKTDSWMNSPYFIVDSLRARMVSAMEGKSTNSYPLRSGLVSFLSESFDYQCV